MDDIEWVIMKFKFFVLVVVVVFFLVCVMMGGSLGDLIVLVWVGKFVGKFFVVYGLLFVDDGFGVVFIWKGGYKWVCGDLKSCLVIIVVSGDYVICFIIIIGDW